MCQRLRPICATAIALILLVSIQPTFAQINLLENGDFEDLTDWGAIGAPRENAPAGWRDGAANRLNAAGQQSGVNAIGGAGTSAYLPGEILPVAVANRKEIIQTLDEMSNSVYRLEFDFASEDPGGAADRSLSMSTRDGANNALRTSFRINGDGDFQSFNGSSYATVLPGAVIFDDDVSVTPLLHHFKFTVDSTLGSYDLTIIDSNSTVHSIMDSTIWRGTPPLGAGFSGIEFNTFNSAGDSLIDNVSLINVPPDIVFTINRDDGSIILTNNGDPINLAAYTLDSDVGGLNAGNWKSIAANYDVDGPNTADGGAFIGTVDPNNSWSELGTPNDFLMTEAELFDVGAVLGAGQSVNLGTGAWRRSPFEEVSVEVLLAGGEIANAEVQYVGNDDISFLFGDLDLDGDVDEDDFKNEYLPNFFADTSALSTVGRYFAGDLNNDGETGYEDFLVLKAAHQAANPGAAALSFTGVAVPEPHAWSLAVVAFFVAGAVRLRNWRRGIAMLGFVGSITVLLAAASSQANILINGDFEDTTDWQFAGTESGTQPLGWRETTDRNPATQQFAGSAIGGTGISAYMPGFAFDAARYSIRQTFSETNPVFNASMDFASTDPGNAEMRSFTGRIQGVSGGPTVQFRVVDEDDDGDGDLQLFSGGVWVSGVLPNSVVFDSSVTGIPLVHNLFMHVDNSTPTPKLDIKLTDSNGLVHSALGLSLFNGTLTPFRGALGIDFNTFNSDGDYLLDNISITSAISDSALSLQVIRSTGQVFLSNTTGQAVSFDAYRVKSSMGLLVTDEWSSLQDQAIDGTPGNPVWTELGMNPSQQIAEGNFNSHTTLADGESISLGKIYNALMDQEDLEFEFHVAGSPPVSLLGSVQYLAGLMGDYNGDNVVNAADYVLWRDALGSTVANPFDGADGNGSGEVDPGDYGVWKQNFGGQLVSASSADSTAVPEPSSSVAAFIALAAFLGLRTRR